MKPAAEKLAAALDGIEIKVPTIAVINNVDVSCEQDPAAIKQALVRQLFSPVRWTETVERMANDGITFEIEMGPGKVLTGLAKRIDPRVEGIHANDAASFELALAQVK
jgi:[acyl-carrier-protein] S-malonyltransferase